MEGGILEVCERRNSWSRRGVRPSGPPNELASISLASKNDSYFMSNLV